MWKMLLALWKSTYKVFYESLPNLLLLDALKKYLSVLVLLSILPRAVLDAAVFQRDFMKRFRKLAYRNSSILEGILTQVENFECRRHFQQ